MAVSHHILPKQRENFFKSLIVGEPTGKKLAFRGLVGGGFGEAIGEKVAGMLAPLETKVSPFNAVPTEVARQARWVRPEYVVEVRFTEITRDGILRHPRFVGIRHVSDAGASPCPKPPRK